MEKFTSTESKEYDKSLRPTWQEVFQAFDEAGVQDFVIQRDRSLPREVDLDLSDEQIDDFMKWVNDLRKARATTKATADSSASLRNDKQKGENESKG